MAAPASRETRRLLARCVSMKVRCRPASLQKGCSAFTTPAPCVQRLPGPGGQRDHRHLPVLSAVSPARRRGRQPFDSQWRRPRRPPPRPRSPRSPAGGSAPGRCGLPSGRRGSARAGRGRSRAPRSSALSVCSAADSALPRGSMTSNSVCTTPRSSGSVAAGRAELVQLGAPQRRERVPVLPQQRRHGQGVIAGRHQRRARPRSRSAKVPRSLMAKS